MEKKISVDEFWQFSLQYYGLNNKQSLLLWLQDNAGLNVNVVLLLIYLQIKSVKISLNNFSDLNKKNQKLDSLTSNYRKKRREIKAENIAKEMNDYRCVEYQELLKVELDLERQQQSNLLEAVLGFTGKDLNNRESGGIDIKRYLRSLVITDDNQHFSKLDNIFEELIAGQKYLTNDFGNL
jgi:uncharacterized protein (TIGR02444 family)